MQFRHLFWMLTFLLNSGLAGFAQQSVKVVSIPDRNLATAVRNTLGLKPIRDSIIFVLFLFIGCSDTDNIFHKTVHIPIQAVDIVSISQDRPAEILFVVAGIKADGCDPSIQKVSAERVGNTIFLRATGSEEIFDSGGYCTSAVEATGGEVVVKDLEVGEYKVATDDGPEFLQFRIEKGAAYVVRKGGIGDLTVQMKTSEGIKLFDADALDFLLDHPYMYSAEPVQVSIGVEGNFFGQACEYFHKIVIDKGSSSIMNVEIFGEAPINADCIRYQQPDDAAAQLLFSGPTNTFKTEIDLGTFGTGDYRVNINGYDDVRFSIRLTNSRNILDRQKQD